MRCPKASQRTASESIQNQLFKLGDGDYGMGDAVQPSYCIPSCQSQSGRDSLLTLLVCVVSVVLFFAKLHLGHEDQFLIRAESPTLETF